MRRIERRGLALLCLSSALSGCAGPPPGGVAPTAEGLRRAIAALGPGVDVREAQRTASVVAQRAGELEVEYRRVGSPRLHNLFVNVGLRHRGLCCHFAEDLIAALRSLDLQTLDVHWAVARHGDPLREHSSVVVVPSGRDWREGLVIDAWRADGRVFWAAVTEDRYPWQLHPLSGDWERLRCL